jgi:photosystem II stability/assembly factor-like uncharacterized protein
MNARGLLILAAAASLAVLTGCSSSPTAPVVVVPLNSLTVVPAADTVFVGQTVTFTAVAIDTGGVPVANPSLHWSTTDPAVLSVSSGGVATGAREGSTLLIVSSAGLADTAAVIVLPVQRGWFAQTSNTSVELEGVYFLPDGNTGWAVGASGRIMKTTNAGQDWMTQVSSTGFGLNAVWFTSATEGWAVGGNGTAMHTTNAGTSWVRNDSVATTADLQDVVFANPDTGWICGSTGLLLHTFNHGVSWRKDFPTAVTLRSLSFGNTRDGWAVGDAGVIVGTHDRGVSWFIVQPAVTGVNLLGVFTRSTTVADAVGDNGTAPRTVVTVPPDSVDWELRNTGNSYDLRSVFFVNDLVGVAVGTNGGINAAARTTNGGINWSTQNVPTGFRLNKVYFIDEMRGWTVGSSGVIMHTVTGGEP